MLDKYIGDALMAVFGILDDEIDPVFKAVGAAVGIRDAIRDMNEERIAEGLDPIAVGVGVNTGTLWSFLWSRILTLCTRSLGGGIYWLRTAIGIHLHR